MMFAALSRIGREQVLKDRRTLRDCEQWERRLQHLLLPPAPIP